MQPAGIMLLDNEPPLFRRQNRRVAARLRGLLEIPFFSIGRKIPQRHDQPRTVNIRAFAGGMPGTEKPANGAEVPEAFRAADLEIVGAVRDCWKGIFRRRLWPTT